jgi:hypothetical protein
MSKTWTDEKITRMLLIIIKRHYSGTPDFEYVAAQLGVTKDAVRIRFNAMRREVSIPDIAEGLATPPSSPPRKRKAKDLQAADLIKEEDDGGERIVKREKTGRKAAVKANGKLTEIFEESEITGGEGDEKLPVKLDK